MPRELNLLPPQRRRLLGVQANLQVWQRILRSIVIALGVLTAGGVGSILISWILILSSSNSISQELMQSIEVYKGERDKIVKQNQVLETMDALQESRLVWSELLPGFFQVVPPGVLVDHVSGQVGRVENILTFGGSAVNRNALIITEDRLLELPWVEAVTAPHSNLIQRINPDYSFTITVGGEE